jgi:hypothetical protein
LPAAAELTKENGNPSRLPAAQNNKKGQILSNFTKTEGEERTAFQRNPNFLNVLVSPPPRLAVEAYPDFLLHYSQPGASHLSMKVLQIDGTDT